MKGLPRKVLGLFIRNYLTDLEIISWKIFKRLRKLFIGKYFTYFAGPMDLAKDSGMKWREKYAPLFVKNIPVVIQDPAQEQCRKFNVKTVRECHRVLAKIRKEKGDKDFFEAILDGFFRPDIRMVRRSDFIIVYWDFQVVSIGTVHEMVEAARLGIPIYFLAEKEGVKNLSTWAQALVWLSGGMMFIHSDPRILFATAVDYLGEKYGSRGRTSLFKAYEDGCLLPIKDLPLPDDGTESEEEAPN